MLPSHRSLFDAVVALAERTYGEEISARVRSVDKLRNEAGFDPFGFDPETARTALALLTFFHRSYFRTQVFGLHNIPHDNVLFVGNHSGHIPIDATIVATALVLDRDPPLLVRSMVEKWAQALPFVSTFFPRVGQVLGTPENARRLLRSGSSLLVFPEGVKGISKPFRKRYQLERFGPGFMRLALETHAPIVPVAIIGAEEQYPALGNLKGAAKWLGMPSLPLIPQLFVGLALPLPTRYRVYFGEPMYFEGDPDDDDAQIEGQVELVRGTIQRMLHRGVAERTHVFW